VTIVVVGAGLAGLVAARDLQDRGRDVIVLEKGSAAGGRLASVRVGSATMDAGAQFFTVRSEAFAARVHGWQHDGIVREWCRGFAATPDGYPRYAVTGGMDRLARHLADGLDVRCSTMAFAVRAHGSTWEVQCDDDSRVRADAVVLAAPVSQSASLLITTDLTLPDELRTIDYVRTLALLVVLDGPAAVPPPGGVQDADATFSFVGDNQAKGASAVPALTLHTSGPLSRALWDEDRDVARAQLLDAARPWFGSARVEYAMVKRWRFAAPETTWPDACWFNDDDGRPVVLAGDAFAGPKVEGAVLSGAAAAGALA
jgi:predicted NAD/FAD-dependent oxidoreductase